MTHEAPRADTSAPTGTLPAGPHRLGGGEWLAVVKRSFREFVRDDCMGLAQQVAFSSLLAFFPAIVFLIGLLGLFGEDAFNTLIDLFGSVAPQGVMELIETARDDSAGQGGKSLFALIAGGVGALWAASTAMNAVIKAVNRAYDRVETRPFWKLRLTAIVLVLLSAVVTSGLLLLIVFGGPLGEVIADEFRLGRAFELFWSIARWPIAFLAILIFFALAYYLAPNQDQRDWRWISPGSAVGGVLWLVLSGLFALYTSFSGSYDKTYGSLAGGIILLLWLNYSAFALLFGAELNSELDREAEIHAAGGPRAGLVKPSRRTAESK